MWWWFGVDGYCSTNLAGGVAPFETASNAHNTCSPRQSALSRMLVSYEKACYRRHLLSPTATNGQPRHQGVSESRFRNSTRLQPGTCISVSSERFAQAARRNARLGRMHARLQALCHHTSLGPFAEWRGAGVCFVSMVRRQVGEVACSAFIFHHHRHSRSTAVRL